jgi:hypothetical protein
MNRLRLSKTVGAVGTVIALAGCGGASIAGLAGGPTPAQSDRGMLQFAHCLRAHGVAVAAPFHRPGHSGLSIDMPTRSPASTAAFGACNHYIAPIIAAKMAHAPTIPQSLRLGLIHYAECMRAHGIAMLDPDRYGSLNLGNVPGISNGIGRYTPQFRLADKTCRRLLPAGVHDNGTGP